MVVVNIARAISVLFFAIVVNQQVISAVDEVEQNLVETDISSQDSNWSVMACPGIGPNMFGDVRYHLGCNLWATDSLSPSFSWPTSSPSSHHQEDKMKPALNKWLDQLSEQLLNSTSIINNLDHLDEPAEGHFEQGKCCRARLKCCSVETRLAYPLYGISLTTGKLIKIIQETEVGGIQQPVLYRHCLSEKTNLVRGRCHQSSLPRLFYVHRDSSSSSSSTSGYPFYQDLLVMPSNCDCLVQLQDEAEVLEGDQDDGNSNTAPVNPEESEKGSGADADDILSSTVV